MIAFAAFHALKRKVNHPLTFQVPRMLRRMVQEGEDAFAVFWNGKDLWQRERWPPYRDRPEIWDEAGRDDFDSMVAVLSGLGVVQYLVEGREADELLAAVAHVLDGNEPVVIRSDDKDFMQLLSPTTAMHGRVRGSVRAERVVDILGVPVEYVVDFLALAGDKADGIPPLAPPAAAREIIARYGHVRDWIAAEGAASHPLLADQLEQLRINLELVDLSADAVGPPPPPITAGWQDEAAVQAVGHRLKIEHLTAPHVVEDFEPLRRYGERGRVVLGSAGAANLPSGS